LNLFPGPILAIETSCDETSVAILRGREILANEVSSQVELHRQWGGVVPEAAARAHVEAMLPMIEGSLVKAALKLSEIELVAVTHRPGLLPALMVGTTTAKAIAFGQGIPVVGVHHMEGHLLSPLMEHAVPFPHVCLIVSGGHTELIRVDAVGSYAILGETRDDAAGEAFDKASRLLGLGYPGGPAIQKAAESGNPTYELPKGLKGATFDFSFSGFKTAVLRLTEKEGDQLRVADAAASVQETITGVLAERALNAARESGAQALTLAGGVAANRVLRSKLAAGAQKRGLPFFVPSFELCTDNAAMIGFVASLRRGMGLPMEEGLDLDVFSGGDLPGIVR
jgi:N6-L-threonylcarbamoyladenine synthase